MGDRYDIYQNIGKALEHRGGAVATPMLTEDAFQKTMQKEEYVVVRGNRSGHRYLPDRDMVFILFSKKSEKISKNDKFLAAWQSIFPKTGPHVDNVVIVTHSALTYYIKSTLASIRAESPNLYIEVCMFYAFLMNFPESSVYCKHEVADPDEVKKLCDQQRTEPLFKKIRADDTGAIWIGARPGDIVKVIRPSHNSGYSIDYLECISA